SSHGHALGKCRVLLPPDVVMRPGRFNIRVRRVLVVMDVTSLPRPMRPTQRPRLWAMTLRVIQTALAQKRPDGRWFTPTPYFKSLMAPSPIQYGIGVQSSSLMAAITLCNALEVLTVTEKLTPALAQAWVTLEL